MFNCLEARNPSRSTLKTILCYAYVCRFYCNFVVFLHTLHLSLSSSPMKKRYLYVKFMRASIAMCQFKEMQADSDQQRKFGLLCICIHM